EYNFRGTNLTPGADGAGFFDAEVTKWNFTLGLFGIHQFGHARDDSWSISEGGGGSVTSTSTNARGSVFDPNGNFLGTVLVPYKRFPTTVQNKFDELDAFLSYKFSLGPIDVTLGNIAFFISRRATTYEVDLFPKTRQTQQFGVITNIHWVIPPTFRRDRTLSPDPTVEEEVFDRLYIRLSTTKLSKYITPQITYYQ